MKQNDLLETTKKIVLRNHQVKIGLLLSLSCFFFIHEISYCQEFLRTEGVIYNSKNQPIKDVTISIKWTSIGTISNENGEFVFIIPKKSLTDTIAVSHIGYSTKYYLSDTNNLLNQKIELLEASYTLDEVQILPTDPFSIILQAKNNIHVNYQNEAYESEGFYREVIKENDKYIEYAEGLLTTLHSPYEKDKKKQNKDLIKLIESRRKKSELENYELSKKISNPIGGPVSCLKYNSVKYPPSFLRPDAQKLYNYKLKDIIDYSGRGVYVIEFNQKEEIKKSLYQGKIYIDKESLAFVHLTYQKYPKAIKYALPGAVTGGLLKLLTSISMVNSDKKVNVHYKTYNGKWYLSYIEYTEIAGFIRKGKSYDILSTKNYLITQIFDEIENSYLEDEILISGEFKDQIGEYDENFWGNYNIIPLEREMKKQIER